MENFVMLQAFEWNSRGEGYYRRLAQEAPRLARRGVNAVWLPPVCKAMGQNDVGYGIYDLYDLGEFEQKGGLGTKYGTKEELLACIEALHAAGILVYADVVLNHKAGADEKELFRAVPVNPENRLEDIGEEREIEGWTGFTFPGRGGKYSDFQWHWYHFTGVDYDERSAEGGIFRIVGENKYWAEGVSEEKGNFDYLMFADIDHSHPEVREELFRWAEWFVGETGVDGFRLDAIKHISPDFIEAFCAHCREKFGPDFYIFGEFWNGDLGRMEAYLEDSGRRSDIFDVALHFNLFHAAQAGADYDLRKIFDGSLNQANPFAAVTFVDNHDSQPDQSLASWVDPAFKERAYALILLRQDGYPCVFAGDYYGLNEEGRENAIKQDIDRLLQVRKALAYGVQEDHFFDPNCIAWLRRGDEEHPHKLLTLVSNAQENQLELCLGPEEAGKVYVDYLANNGAEIELDGEGRGCFPVSPASVSCWAERGLDLEDLMPEPEPVEDQTR